MSYSTFQFTAKDFSSNFQWRFLSQAKKGHDYLGLDINRDSIASLRSEMRPMVQRGRMLIFFYDDDDKASILEQLYGRCTGRCINHKPVFQYFSIFSGLWQGELLH